MSDIEKYEELQELAIGFKLLYVEDNKGLRVQAAKIFEKIFGKVYTAENGKEGLEIFKKVRPKLVITDIRMPDMDGLEMTRRILRIAPQTKVIITSTYNDCESLMEAINTGVFRYLTKPINIAQLTTTLLEGLKHIRSEEEDRLFTSHIKHIFASQTSLLIMYHRNKPVMANHAFLEFFDAETLERFVYRYGSLGHYFLPHEGFLYEHNAMTWFSTAVNNIDHFYYVLMKDQSDVTHHFIFKMIAIEDEDNYFLVAMHDVTELGLLKLFEQSPGREEDIVQDRRAMMRLLETAKHTRAQIKMHNLYKGLTIANKGFFVTVNDDRIELKSTYLQQKGVQHEGRLILSHELFPHDILCQKIKGINFEHQTIEVGDLIFTRTSPSMRKSIRLRPDDKHTVTLLFEDRKFGEGVRVADISLEAVKLSLPFLPAGFDTDATPHIDMVFNVENKPLIIHTQTRIFEIRKQKKEYEIVLMLQYGEATRKLLVDYLAHRQIELIREFKGLQHGL